MALVIRSTPQLTGGTAQYVLNRLLAEKRITAREITQYVADLATEIAHVEARLRFLRDANAPAARASYSPERRPAQRTRAHAGGDGKALGGMYGGLIRRVPKAVQAQYAEIKAKEGIRAAIAALQKRKRM